jgi:Transcriptional regulators
MVMHDILKDEIQNGTYVIGEFLPTETELEKIFQVSRTTVRRATELLANEGLVEIKQGRGTMVLDYKTHQDLNKVTSVTESLRRKGYIISTKSMFIDTIPATEKLAQELQVAQGELLARIQRIQMADQKPVVIMKNYIPYSLVPEIEKYNNQFLALYEFMEEHYQVEIDGAKDKIYAKSADFTESEMLSISPGTALLCIRRICYYKQKPVCVDHVSIIGDQYELDISMQGRLK